MHDRCYNEKENKLIDLPGWSGSRFNEDEEILLEDTIRNYLVNKKAIRMTQGYSFHGGAAYFFPMESTAMYVQFCRGGLSIYVVGYEKERMKLELGKLLTDKIEDLFIRERKALSRK